MKSVIVSLAAVVFASCAPSTPEARIAARPELFEALPPRERALVRQGRLAQGMGRDAVLLAWGRPSREYEGSEGGVATLRWDYLGSTPVYQTTYFGGFGYGLGYGCGRFGRGPFNDFAVFPEVAYVPYRRATVLFRDGRVDSWERSR
jgi:hypothetical protein